MYENNVTAAKAEVKKFILGNAIEGSKIFCFFGLYDAKWIVRLTPIPLEKRTCPAASLQIESVKSLLQSHEKIKLQPIVFPSKKSPFTNKMNMIRYGRGMITYTTNLEVSIPLKADEKVRTAHEITLMVIQIE